LIWKSQVMSFFELDQEVDRWAARLSAAGVRPDQHIGLLLPNRPETIFLIYALARLGAVLIPFNLRLSARELAWQADQADCRLILHDQASAAMPARLEPGAARWLDIDMPGDLKGSALIETTPESWAPERVQAIVFTSGTTGQPKGVQLTFGNHFWSATASALRLGVLPEDSWLLNLPLYHVGGLAIVFRSCLYGTAVVLQQGFDPQATLQAILVEGVSVVSLVPTMLYRLLELPHAGEILARLRYLLLGGAGAQPTLLKKALAAAIPLAVTYGMTETASQIATAAPELSARKPGSAGKPLLFCRLRIVNDLGQDLPPGETGQILVNGPTVMPGYYRQDRRPANSIQTEWFATGDLGYLDTDGDLWVVQRRVDLIISGGENIYPVQVEQTLLEHPAVAQACVVGYDDIEWGQQVGALVSLCPGASVDVEELLAFCRQRLAAYKTPRRLRIVAQVPQGETGKLLRKEAAALLEVNG
jgi:O-succinylbenzoic acid--CoA ligase